MTRDRYWKLSIEELEKSHYDPNKVITWDIKCIIKPENDAKFIGVFMYRNGTPYNYESINGITYYHNNITKNILNDITKMLKDNYGGDELQYGSRVFLKNSKEIYSAEDLVKLSRKLKKKFKPTIIIITIEFQDMNDNEKSSCGLPENKLLPIPGNK